MVFNQTKNGEQMKKLIIFMILSLSLISNCYGETYCGWFYNTTNSEWTSWGIMNSSLLSSLKQQASNNYTAYVLTQNCLNPTTHPQSIVCGTCGGNTACQPCDANSLGLK